MFLYVVMDPAYWGALAGRYKQDLPGGFITLNVSGKKVHLTGLISLCSPFLHTLFRTWISPYTRKAGAYIGAAIVYIYTKTY
jgi:hypothetical protein